MAITNSPFTRAASKANSYQFTAGKQRVTVKFQAQPESIAGGVFGCKILRAR